MDTQDAEVPLRGEFDLLIIGGGSGAVACALAAKKRGLSVFVAAPRPYLGEDIAAYFDYWPAPGSDLSHPLAAELFASVPPTPMHIKRTLEQALVTAGIPFLLNAHPAGVLRAADGRAGGALLAHRSGCEAVAAGQVVDASCQSLLARQAAAFPAFKGKAMLRHVTLGGETKPGLKATELKPMQALGSTGPVELKARAYSVELELDCADPSSLARAQARLVELCWDKGAIQQSEWLDTRALDAPQGELPPHLHVLRGRDASECIAKGEALGRALEKMPLPEGELSAGSVSGRPLAGGELRLSLAPLRRSAKPGRRVRLGKQFAPRLGSFDVVVVGGGTGGAPAAVGAARAGARTLVCETLPALGGVGTLGQIAIYYYGNRVGFTSEVDAGVAGMEPRRFPKPGSWSPPAKQAWLHQACVSAGAEIWFTTACAGALVEGGKLKGLLLAGPFGFGLVEAKAVVDATGNADVAAAAGAECTAIGAAHVAVQGTGLAGIKPGHHYHNTDHSFSDDCDAEDATQFLVSAKQKFKDHFDGGQLVDSRERRQIVGEAVLDPFDFICSRHYADTICVSSSNFDSHGYTIHPLFLVKPPDEEQLWVEVPYRCLLPRGLDGLLVTGLGISAHRDAIPVVRMQPDVQNQGYAAGRAAAMSAATGLPLRKIDLPALQRHLVEIGNLPASILGQAESPPLSADEMAKAVDEGWDSHPGLAMIFHDPGLSLPLLKRAYPGSSGAKRLRLATILGLMDEGLGSAELIRHLEASAWDEGWSYRGMGQFGMSVSAIDCCLMALGRCGDPAAWPVLLRYAQRLPEDPAMSHCRALAESFETLHAASPNPQAAQALAAILDRPGMSGHAQLSIPEVQAALSGNPNETRVRDLALREIHLARGAYRCGGHPRAKAVLERYALDLRGHFARHARAVLAA